MVGFYNYTVIITYAGLASALFGMTRAVQGDMRAALLCLMVCGLCDMFDGTIARTRDRSVDEKRFGALIDSLSDMVCFGVFPAVIGYGLGVRSLPGYLCLFFYVLAALIRLAYFDVDELPKIGTDTPRRTHFQGLPVTNAAFIIPTLMLFNIFSGKTYLWLYCLELVIIGLLFIIKFRMKKAYTRGLLIVAAIGLVIFILIIVYGDSIQCLNSSTSQLSAGFC